MSKNKTPTARSDARSDAQSVVTAGLVALVTVELLVDGVRTAFAPGDELPELNPHDARELLRSSSVADPAQAEQAAREQAKAQKAADGEFEQARQDALAARASTQAPGQAHSQEHGAGAQN